MLFCDIICLNKGGTARSAPHSNFPPIEPMDNTQTNSTKEIVVRFTIPEGTNFDIKSGAGSVRLNKNDYMRQLLIDKTNNDLSYTVFDQYQYMIQQSKERDEITICDRWKEPDGQGLINFANDIGPRPSMNHVIAMQWGYQSNRLEESLVYSPSTVKWAISQANSKVSEVAKERIQKVSSMLSDGSTIKEIAEEFGTSENKVQFFIHSLGLN